MWKMTATVNSSPPIENQAWEAAGCDKWNGVERREVQASGIKRSPVEIKTEPREHENNKALWSNAKR